MPGTVTVERVRFDEARRRAWDAFWHELLTGSEGADDTAGSAAGYASPGRGVTRSEVTSRKPA